MHPHYTRWLNEQVNLIRQTGGLSALPLAEIQEEIPMFEQENTQEAPAVVRCEYCHEVLKSDKRQARVVHLRYCEAYKAAGGGAKKNGLAKHNGATPSTPAFAEGTVTLTPEQASKLWQAITGGRLEMAIEAGQVVCKVSLDSFNKALPVLLERL